MFGFFNLPKPCNEPILGYLPGSKEKIELKAKLNELKNTEIEIPVIIGGKEIRTGDIGYCVMPHKHGHKLARYHKAGEKEVRLAIKTAMEAKAQWDKYGWHERAAIFVKAAELLSGSHRAEVNAATMLGVSKTAFQAEIDSACETIDFFRFNTHSMMDIYKSQPSSCKGLWNYMEYRPLDGFVFAVTPFNFTSIGANLSSAPAMMGNTVIWKPAVSAIYSAYHIMKLFMAAGVPDGVINFLPGSGAVIGPMVLTDENFAGVHFTGSTEVFNGMYKSIGDHIDKYRAYPRIVGETGGKDFIFAHPTADVEALRVAMIRGAFEYQGQKCSAASRAYIPKSIWAKLKDRLVEEIHGIKMGDIEDFTTFMGAVIDKNSFNNVKSYLDYVKNSPDAEIIVGGKLDDSVGYFVEPTVILAHDPKFKTMQEEIFAPVLTVYVYEDEQYEATLKLCDGTSVYALTGSIFAEDRWAVKQAYEALRYSAGNFYINDKPTGAVVDQQPFGGARKSGTNDKAGSYLNLLRWVSARTVKETFCPPHDYRYPYMAEA